MDRQDGGESRVARGGRWQGGDSGRGSVGLPAPERAQYCRAREEAADARERGVGLRYEGQDGTADDEDGRKSPGDGPYVRPGPGRVRGHGPVVACGQPRLQDPRGCALRGLREAGCLGRVRWRFLG